MSRIGKKPIIVPKNVKVRIEGQKIIVEGPKGNLTRNFRPEINIELKDGIITVSPKARKKAHTKSSKKKSKQKKALSKAEKPSTRETDSVQVRAFWGLERALLQNMITGVTEGFEKKLEIRGIGYRAKLEEEKLILQVGFTHPVTIEPLGNAQFSVEGNIITVSGIDKNNVGQLAAKIRKVRPPDRYKGKGIRYLGEEIKLKPGKRVVTAG